MIDIKLNLVWQFLKEATHWHLLNASYFTETCWKNQLAERKHYKLHLELVTQTNEIKHVHHDIQLNEFLDLSHIKVTISKNEHSSLKEQENLFFIFVF